VAARPRPRAPSPSGEPDVPPPALCASTQTHHAPRRVMARRGALPSSGPCRAPRAGETPHAPLVDGRMQSDECARGAGARSWPGSRASAKAPALLTQRERFLKISDGIHGALARGRHRPAVASPAKQTAATVHAAAGRTHREQDWQRYGGHCGRMLPRIPKHARQPRSCLVRGEKVFIPLLSLIRSIT